MKLFTIKTTLILLLTLLVFNPVFTLTAQENISQDQLNGKWEIIAGESEFSFKITTIWIFPVSGTIGGLSGEIDFDKKNTNDFVHLKLNPSTLNTGNDKRDEHLLSEDFFYVNEYPLIEFKGNSIELKDPKDQIYNVKGTLTIRGVSHEEIIPVKLLGYTDASKSKLKFTGSVKIDRNKYNLDYTGRMIEDKAKVKYTITTQKK